MPATLRSLEAGRQLPIKRAKSRPRKLQPIDYAVMFGGPVAFLLLAALLVRSLLGPLPRKDPVERLRDGEIRIGATVNQVLSRLGQPRELIENPDGSITIRYLRSVWERDAAIEEGTVEIGPAGTVTSVRVELQTIGPSGPENP